MGKFVNDIFSKVTGEIIWESIKSNFIGATMSSMFVGLITWLQGASWFIILPIALGLFLIGTWLQSKFTKKSDHRIFIEFFPDRETMELRAPLSQIFNGANEICGHFLSGEGIFFQNILILIIISNV